MIIDIKNKIIPQDLLESVIWENNNISTDVLRLDKLHPIASGNKLFKLELFLQKALETSCNTIITTGGPYSNHLLATAYICKVQGIHSVGIVKTYRKMELNPTLKDCEELGMELVFMPPSDFNNAEKIKQFKENYANSLWIDMGGYSVEGAEGCKEILNLIDHHAYTHIIVAVGTGTTLAGLCIGALKHQTIIGISSMKNNSSLQQSINHLLYNIQHAPFQLIHDFHFGGFAKYSPALIHFMNNLYQTHNIPTDIVYTGKVFYAVKHLIDNCYFPLHSKLLIIHTGGLQGNRSLPKNTLIF